jgi:putative restriction endonuclease
MMTADIQAQAFETVQQLNVWHRRGERAPHKPLLILVALSLVTSNSKRLQPFEELYESLTMLLLRYSPDRKHLHPEYPFWRLESDIWEVVPRTGVRLRKGQTDPPKSELIRIDAKGGFVEPLWNELRKEPQFANKVAAVVLHAYFPGVMHADLVHSLHLPVPTTWMWPMSLPPDLIAGISPEQRRASALNTRTT